MPVEPIPMLAAFVVALVLILPTRAWRDEPAWAWLAPLGIGAGALVGLILWLGRTLWPIIDFDDWMVVVIPVAAICIALASVCRLLIALRWGLIWLAGAIAVALPLWPKTQVIPPWGWPMIMWWQAVLLGSGLIVGVSGLLTWSVQRDRSVVLPVLAIGLSAGASLMIMFSGSSKLGGMGLIVTVAAIPLLLMTVHQRSSVMQIAWTLPLAIVGGLVAQAYVWSALQHWHIGALLLGAAIPAILRLPIATSRPWARAIVAIALAAGVVGGATGIAARQFFDSFKPTTTTGNSADDDAESLYGY